MSEAKESFRESFPVFFCRWHFYSNHFIHIFIAYFNPYENTEGPTDSVVSFKENLKSKLFGLIIIFNYFINARLTRQLIELTKIICCALLGDIKNQFLS